jgi:hypothetical protein
MWAVLTRLKIPPSSFSVRVDEAVMASMTSIPRRGWLGWLGALALWASVQPALAEPTRPRVGVNGYFRLGARPDFQGGAGKLGYWNLYGRLLNEGSYAELDMRLRLLDATPGTNEPWTTAHLRLSGGSIANADFQNGSLGNFNLAHVFVRAGNVLVEDVTWQIGTQDVWLGDLGLYDFRPSTLFFEMIGLSARYQKGPVDFMAAVGDSGFRIRGLDYSPILTGGGYVRLSLNKHVDIALGGQVLHEPGVRGSRTSPYDTPGIDYEDWVRGEVIQTFLDDNPGRIDDFPDPVGRNSTSGKGIFYLGFGNFGRFRWNSLYASLTLRHPDSKTVESYQGTDHDLYVTSLTDERYELFIGNEMQLQLIPNRWDLIWGAVYGNHWDRDNDISPSDFDRWYASGVLRSQVYINPTVHVLVESSIAREVSKNGNTYRNRGDSIFTSQEGLADVRGLEYGDSDTRDTWQGKAGVVLSPMGPGIYVRPSLRLLYGVQYSTQSNAFGNSFVESVSDLNDFGAWETHWHHVLSVEVETWF